MEVTGILIDKNLASGKSFQENIALIFGAPAEIKNGSSCEGSFSYDRKLNFGQCQNQTRRAIDSTISTGAAGEQMELLRRLRNNERCR
jgi:hypothetical protein